MQTAWQGEDPELEQRNPAMTNEQLLAEIREANLTYLMLAQNLIRHDKAEAVFRLGMNEDSADILASLSAAQVLKLASRNTLLCSFRVDDNLVWSLLTNHTAKKVGNEATNTLHANILMASRVSEVL
jgi:flagellar transcriptional activator FlhD